MCITRNMEGKKKEEKVLGNLFLEVTRNQENCWKSVDKEIRSLKDGIKGIIDTFKKSPGPSKTKKIMSMIQKISQDVETMKVVHEPKIEKMKEYVSDVKKT